MKGYILAFIMWVLALLSILAAIFIANTQAEKDISRNFSEETIAKSYAQSGFEYGLSKIKTTLAKGFFDKEGNQEAYLNNEEVVQQADGKFAVRIEDLQGKINVNDGVGYPKDHSLNKNLERILNILGEQPTIGINNLGSRIVDQRPASGFVTEYDLHRVLGSEYEKIVPHLTTHTWKNNKVANPVPICKEELSYYPVKFPRPLGQNGNEIYRRGHNINSNGSRITEPLKFFSGGDGPDQFKSAIFSYDTLNPQWIEIVQRSPVNVNTATKEVLVSLISQLQGFYVQERRLPNPPFLNVGPMWYHYNSGQGSELSYGYFYRKQMGYNYNFQPESLYKNNQQKFLSTDHIGILQLTNPFDKVGVDPERVAEEIIELRNGKYRELGFGGPLKSWAQFNLFVNHLVKIGFFSDNRDLFYDFTMDPNIEEKVKKGYEQKSIITFQVDSVESPIQRRISSQATADVLKANFNPNLNINEFNPNRNLMTLVDKTDLVVNSTEFCFLPMGYFKINSRGEYKVGESTQSIKEVSGVIKLYDVHYETTQEEFYQGTFGDSLIGIKTNNGYAVETGPEPDNGKAPMENKYSGYVSLSTFLGIGKKRLTTEKGELWTTYDKPGIYANAKTTPYPLKSEGFDSDMNIHYQLDHVASYHELKTKPPAFNGQAPDYTLPVGPIEGTYRQFDSRGHGKIINIAKIHNYSDREESSKSPYSPVNGDKYRLCRSFSALDPARPLYSFEPSDLRTDGAYFEFNSGVSYHTPFRFPREDEVAIMEIFNGTPEEKRYELNQMSLEMFMSFYIKPNFYPECSERTRQFVTTNTYEFMDIHLQGLYWLPAYHSNSTTLPISMFSAPPRSSLLYNLRPSAWLDKRNEFPFMWYSYFSYEPFEGFSQFVFASPMNVDSRSYNYLERNKWVHVMLEAKIQPLNQLRLETSKIYINGKSFDENIPFVNYHGTQGYMGALIDFLRYGPFITIGGECTSIFKRDHPMIPLWGIYDTEYYVENRYFFADSTIDEYFIWFNNNTKGLLSSNTISSYGRYYKPLGDLNDGFFKSRTIEFDKNVTILGISWTAYAEDYQIDSGKLVPIFYNYHDDPPTPMPIKDLIDINGFTISSPCLIEIKALKEGMRDRDYNNSNNNTLQGVVKAGLFGNDGYSTVHFNLKPVLANELNYNVKFLVGATSRLDTILMSTPIFDDITIFYAKDSGTYLSYMIN